MGSYSSTYSQHHYNYIARYVPKVPSSYTLALTCVRDVSTEYLLLVVAQYQSKSTYYQSCIQIPEEVPKL